MGAMFAYSKFQQDISVMFGYSQFNHDVSGWNIESLQRAECMFEDSNYQIIPKWADKDNEQLEQDKKVNGLL